LSDNKTPNYPDLLGHITGGERVNIGVTQVALAVRPRVVRAGRPFEVIMVIQNASDVDVDLTVKLHIPDRDSNKKKGRFVAKAEKLVIGMQAAEVGYVVLPMSCLPDTGISPDYRVGMEISVKTLDKANRIRHASGGGPVEMDHLDEAIVEEINGLKQLNFSANKRSGLRSTILEASFSVMSGRVGAITDLQPGWTSLWTLRDHLDDRMLLQRYWQTIKDMVLPGIMRDKLYEPLLEQTEKRFDEAGYPLKKIEASFITRLLILILEYAAPSQATHGSHGHLAAGIYNILPLLKAERLASDEPFTLPHWVGGMLRAIIRDERAARYPAQAITRFLYEDLLFDAATYAFTVVETTTGEDLGNDEEIAVYIGQLLTALQGEAPLNFTRAYLPLVLGGIVVYDRVMLEDEKLDELIQEMRAILTQRGGERTRDNEPIFRMAERLIDQAMMKYGYKGR
jgi:hypothetical protein